MFRRSFLSALSAVPVLPRILDRPNPDQRPAVPAEGSLMFWFHFYGAIRRDRPMSTERARKQVVEELNLQNLTDDEAVRFLELANDGVYDTEDMPGQWSSVFEEMEENFSREISVQTSDREI